jgi:hypothetical protein
MLRTIQTNPPQGEGIAVVIVEVDKASVCDANDKVVCWDVERGWDNGSKNGNGWSGSK